uniref:autophagy protein 5-like isoform X1 n=2 Tax=Myxine glutinosa TaxID=7769 RepID=UPI00358F3975
MSACCGPCVLSCCFVLIVASVAALTGALVSPAWRSWQLAMAEERDILRAVWAGRVPARFTLAPEEPADHDLEPYYVLLPRVSYLPLVTDKVLRHFHKALKAEDAGDVWFDFEGTPLKWHYPVGLLFDLYATNSSLPWNITVHFKGYPQDELLLRSSKEEIETQLMSTLKEADSIKHRGGAGRRGCTGVMSELQRKEHRQIWLGLSNGKFEQFWAVNRKLMDVPPEETAFRHIPFRLYQADSDRPYMQRLMRPTRPSGQMLTLQDLLQSVLPGGLPHGYDIVTHGIRPPLDTPLQWLSEHLSYPDNFLHLCLVPVPKTHC